MKLRRAIPTLCGIASVTTFSCGRGTSVVSNAHGPDDSASGESASGDVSTLDSTSEDVSASGGADGNAGGAESVDSSELEGTTTLATSDAAGSPGVSATLDAASPSENPCTDTYSSDLDGVSLRIVSEACVFTSEELAEGVVVEYELVVTETLSGVFPFDAKAPCWEPQDNSGLAVLELIEGGDQAYCRRCDLGRCRVIDASSAPETSPEAGQYRYEFTWFGHNFRGPADFGDTEDRYPAFPEGNYVLSIVAQGEWLAPGEAERRPFEVKAERAISLVTSR